MSIGMKIWPLPKKIRPDADELLNKEPPNVFSRVDQSTEM